MTRLTMYQVDAFTDRLFHGNPAAVLVLDDWLDDATMAAIAMENNLAETAFVRPHGGDWQLRWFTPVHEVAFCGHATLATAHVLAAELGETGALNFHTRHIGQLSVSNAGGRRYTLDIPRLDPQPLEPAPAVYSRLFPNGCADSFRNFENYYAVLESEAEVRQFVPDLAAIGTLFPAGLVITAAANNEISGQHCDFVSRYFAPAAGIPEDPVTGSTHASLVPYWANQLGRTTMQAYQASARGGWLGCELLQERVLLTGGAVTFMKAEISVP